MTASLMSGCVSGNDTGQTALDKMAVSCNLPKGTAIHHPDDVAELKIAQDAKFDDVECLFEKLKAAGVKNLSFIGNAAISEEEQD